MRDKTDLYVSLRLISTIILLLAVVLSGITLLVASKNAARVVFVVILVVGYGYVFVRWQREKKDTHQE